MMTSADEFGGLLSETMLADLPLGYGPRGTIMVQQIPSERLLEAWQAAHALIPATGRWPLMVTDRGHSLVLGHDPTAGPGTEELSTLDRAARSTDPWQHFPRCDGRLVFDYDLELVSSGIVRLDLSEKGRREMAFPATEEQADRWAYERVLADPVLAAQVQQGARRVVQTNRWFTPDNVSLLLLPTDLPWLAAAWAYYYPTQGKPREAFAAVLWQWHQQYDARLVAFWDTMLQFTVHRPPRPGAQAWTLAGQIKSLAASLEITRWELAAVLPEGEAWFLHDRP